MYYNFHIIISYFVFNKIGKSFEILILVFPHCLEFGDIKGKEVSIVANIHWILFQKLGFYLFI